MFTSNMHSFLHLHDRRLPLPEDDALAQKPRGNELGRNAAVAEQTAGRAVGLIGGLGPGATEYYRRELLKAHAERSRQMRLVMPQADPAQVIGFVDAGNTLGLARDLAEFVQRLAEAGAEMAAMSAVTPYVTTPMLRDLSPLPIIDMAAATSEALAACDIKRVALFGTRTVIQSRLFGWLAGVEVMTPKPDETERLHRICLAAVERTGGTAGLRKELVRIGRGLVKRERLDAIVLAATELATLFDGQASPGFSVVDCAWLHIQAITEAACETE